MALTEQHVTSAISQITSSRCIRRCRSSKGEASGHGLVGYLHNKYPLPHSKAHIIYPSPPKKHPNSLNQNPNNPLPLTHSPIYYHQNKDIQLTPYEVQPPLPLYRRFMSSKPTSFTPHPPKNPPQLTQPKTPITLYP
jgi:hypothetical protein